MHHRTTWVKPGLQRFGWDTKLGECGLMVSGREAAIVKWRSGGYEKVGGEEYADMKEEERVADGKDKICLITQ